MERIALAGLVLEPLTVAHAEAMFQLLSDPEIYRYLDRPPPPSLEQLRQTYARQELRESPDGAQIWLNWIIFLPDGVPIGYLQATITSPKIASIAYVLASPYWGKGHAFAATTAMLEQLTSRYGVERIFATIDAQNQRSRRLLERLGFRPATQPQIQAQGISDGEHLFVW